MRTISSQNVTFSRDVVLDIKIEFSSQKAFISIGAILFEDDLDAEGAALAVQCLTLANIILKMMHKKYNTVMIMNSPPKLPRDMFEVPLMLVAQFPEPSHLSLIFWRSLFCSRVIIASEKSSVKGEFSLNACSHLSL